MEKWNILYWSYSNGWTNWSELLQNCSSWGLFLVWDVTTAYPSMLLTVHVSNVSLTFFSTTVACSNKEWIDLQQALCQQTPLHWCLLHTIMDKGNHTLSAVFYLHKPCPMPISFIFICVVFFSYENTAMPHLLMFPREVWCFFQFQNPFQYWKYMHKSDPMST